MPERLGGGRWRAAGRRQAEAPRVPALPPGREAPLSSPPGAHWAGAEGPTRPGGEETRGGPRRGGDSAAPPPPPVSPGGCGRCPRWGEGSERRWGDRVRHGRILCGAKRAAGGAGTAPRGAGGGDGAGAEGLRDCGQGRPGEGPGGCGQGSSCPGGCGALRAGFGPVVGYGWHPCAGGCAMQPLLLCTEPEPPLWCPLPCAQLHGSHCPAHSHPCTLLLSCPRLCSRCALVPALCSMVPTSQPVQRTAGNVCRGTSIPLMLVPSRRVWQLRAPLGITVPPAEAGHSVQRSAAAVLSWGLLLPPEGMGSLAPLWRQDPISCC